MRPGPGALSFVVEGDITYADVRSKVGRLTPWSYPAARSGQNAGGDQQGFQQLDADIEQHAGSDQPAIQLFAIGDSWVYQNKILPKKEFFNLISELREQGFSFEASSPTYPNVGDDVFPLFNFVGKKLNGLEALDTAVGKRQAKLDSNDSALELKAIILSAGGNDIAAYKNGKDLNPDYTTPRLFGLLVENPDSVANAFDLDAKNKFFDELKEYYKLTLKMLLSRMRAPILIHGYDYPVPDGRPALYDNKVAAGPWLQGVFEKKKIRQDLRKEIMRDLISRLNSLISDLVVDAEKFFSDEDRARLHYVNFAGILEKQSGYNDQPDGYKTYWANELHPTKPGLKILTQEVINKLTEIGVVKANADIAAAPAVPIA